MQLWMQVDANNQSAINGGHASFVSSRTIGEYSNIFGRSWRVVMMPLSIMGDDAVFLEVQLVHCCLLGSFAMCPCTVCERSSAPAKHTSQPTNHIHGNNTACFRGTYLRLLDGDQDDRPLPVRCVESVRLVHNRPAVNVPPAGTCTCMWHIRGLASLDGRASLDGCPGARGTGPTPLPAQQQSSTIHARMHSSFTLII